MSMLFGLYVVFTLGSYSAIDVLVTASIRFQPVPFAALHNLDTNDRNEVRTWLVSKYILRASNYGNL